VMGAVVRRSDLRRVFLKQSTPEEAEQEAGAAAMAEVASLFPYLIVTGVQQVERRRGGWFVAVVTKERKKGQRKVTEPTHRDGETRVTTPLEPLAPLEEQIEEIRRHSRKVLGDPEALLDLVGNTEDEAATLFAALRQVQRGGQPSSDNEAAVVALIEEYLGEPTGDGQTNRPTPPSGPVAESRSADPAPAESSSDSPSTQGAAETKQCRKCREERAVTEFSRDRRAKDGRASICKLCRRTQYQKYYQARKAGEAQPPRDAVEPKDGNGATTVELDPSWRELFADPSLGQLELLRSFLGDVTFDETVRITRAIAGTEEAQ